MNKNEPLFIRVTPDARTAMIFDLERDVDSLDANLLLAKLAHKEALAAHHLMVRAGAPEELLQESAQRMVSLEENMAHVQRNIDSMRRRLAAMLPVSEDRRHATA